MKTILLILTIGFSRLSFGQFAYVGSDGGNQLLVIDLNNQTIINSINIGGSAAMGAFTNDFLKFYVPVFDNNLVLEINPITHTIVDTIPVGNHPTELILNDANTLAYVCNQGSNTVSVIDLSSNTVTQTLPVGSYPTQLALSPDETSLCVTNSYDFEVGTYYLSPFVTLSPLSFPSTTIGIKPAPGFGQYLCSMQGDEIGKLALIEPFTNLIDTIFDMDNRPHGVMSNGSKIYATSLDSSTVTVIDLNNNQRTVVSVGQYPTCITMDLTGQYYYTTNTYSGTLSKMDAVTDLVVGTIPAGSNPYSISIFPKNVGLQEMQNIELSVYPNPNTGAFTVKLPDNGEKQLFLRSLDGKQVAKYKTSQEVFQLNEQLESGYYILTVVSNHSTLSVKVEVN